MPPTSGQPSPRKRAIVYVDGFNLYYGALKGGPHKWLNLERYFQMLRPDDDLQKIRYFTARITGSGVANQDAYLQALETLPRIEIILGRFKSKQIKCRVAACPAPAQRRVFSTYEEKRTDVNIALWMLHDAQAGSCDRLILVSGDSDLVPAVNMVKSLSPAKEIIVYIPARSPIRGAAVELRSAADKDRLLPLGLLPKAQFPSRLPAGPGRTIPKPASW